MRHTGADKDSAGAANSSDADDRMGGGVSKGELESCLFQYESTFDDYLEVIDSFSRLSFTPFNLYTFIYSLFDQT